MKKKLLFLCHRIPYPPNKGDKIRSFNLLKHLARDYQLYLGAFVDDPHDWRHVDEVHAMCAQTCFIRLDRTRARLRSLKGLLRGEALTLPYYRSRRMRRWVNGVLASHELDGILVYSSAMAQYVMHVDDGTHRVIDFVDVDSDKWNQYAASHRWPFDWIYRREGRELLAYDRRAAARFDASVFVSAHEVELFRRLAPESAAKTLAINNGVDVDYFDPQGEHPNPYPDTERALVFTGAMDYWANVDAVRWFAREVFPRLLAEHADLRFYIVGARPAPQVRELEHLPGIRVTGAVADIRPYLAHAQAAVAPLRIARGIQNKVLEAMAMGRPVIATDQAIEGIEARVGEELLAANDAAEFAERLDRLLAGDGFAEALGQAARARILQRYDWHSQLTVLERLLDGGRQGGAPVEGAAGEVGP